MGCFGMGSLDEAGNLPRRSVGFLYFDVTKFNRVVEDYNQPKVIYVPIAGDVVTSSTSNNWRNLSIRSAPTSRRL
jgi:hypothetical protein